MGDEKPTGCEPEENTSSDPLFTELQARMVQKETLVLASLSPAERALLARRLLGVEKEQK